MISQLPMVNLPATKRIDVTCDHVTTGLAGGVAAARSAGATVFGQSMHLLVDQDITQDAFGLG